MTGLAVTDNLLVAECECCEARGSCLLIRIAHMVHHICRNCAANLASKIGAI